MALAVVLNPIPSAPIALVSGALFGHVWGTLYVVIGAETGALIAFGIARLLGHDLLRRLFGERVALGWLGSQNTLTWLVFVSRLLPFVSFDLVSYGAGLTHLRAWRFALATLVGLIPVSFLLAHFGGEMAQADLGHAMTSLVLIGLLVALPVAVQFIRSRIGRGPDTRKH
ncbi:MAG: VTT domain-containing protein [Gammaproteobacteria bacterium]|nr:VTT domain-containing protein [Gammaproteobacteria bacterium]MBU1654832.1 VTT domain-containing protein [Gammaproteobacteria bacterium]MBU1961099.1 VTT domain-containing protein [Gammaproteobacteria bacterium]